MTSSTSMGQMPSSMSSHSVTNNGKMINELRQSPGVMRRQLSLLNNHHPSSNHSQNSHVIIFEFSLSRFPHPRFWVFLSKNTQILNFNHHPLKQKESASALVWSKNNQCSGRSRTMFNFSPLFPDENKAEHHVRFPAIDTEAREGRQLHQHVLHLRCNDGQRHVLLLQQWHLRNGENPAFHRYLDVKWNEKSFSQMPRQTKSQQGIYAQPKQVPAVSSFRTSSPSEFRVEFVFQSSKTLDATLVAVNLR